MKITEAKALEIANKYYPEANCVILTGSQVEPEFLTSQSDVDIVVIDKQFAGVSSAGLLEEGYKIDFTRVDYFNLINILVDNSYSSCPIILHMINGGVILKDTDRIGFLAKEFARQLIKCDNNNSHNDIVTLKRGLVKLKKHLLKNLNRQYDVFLLNDFIRLITSSYLFIRDDGRYPHDGYRQAKTILMKENVSQHLDNMSVLARGFMTIPRSYNIIHPLVKTTSPVS